MGRENSEATRSSVGPTLFDVDLDDLLGQGLVPWFEFGRASQEVDRAVGVDCAQQLGGVGVGIDELVEVDLAMWGQPRLVRGAVGFGVFVAVSD